VHSQGSGANVTARVSQCGRKQRHRDRWRVAAGSGGHACGGWPAGGGPGRRARRVAVRGPGSGQGLCRRHGCTGGCGGGRALGMWLQGRVSQTPAMHATAKSNAPVPSPPPGAPPPPPARPPSPPRFALKTKPWRAAAPPPCAGHGARVDACGGAGARQRRCLDQPRHSAPPGRPLAGRIRRPVARARAGACALRRRPRRRRRERASAEPARQRGGRAGALGRCNGSLPGGRNGPRARVHRR
jgi:hypothetical protein